MILCIAVARSIEGQLITSIAQSYLSRQSGHLMQEDPCCGSCIGARGRKLTCACRSHSGRLSTSQLPHCKHNWHVSSYLKTGTFVSLLPIMSGQNSMHNLTTLIKRCAEVRPGSGLDGHADGMTGLKLLHHDWKT